MWSPPAITSWKKCSVTVSLAAVSVAATLLWWDGKDMSGLLANYEISQGQVYRLFTSVLLHVNFFHLAFNVYWLLVFGTLVEVVYGHFCTLAIYLLLAVTSSAAEYALAQGGVGLSGVGYGLFGLVWVLSRKDVRFRGPMDPQTVGLFAFWFVICIVLTAKKIMLVGNIAHGAGAIAGTLLGLCLSRQGLWRTVGIAATSAFTLVCLVGAIALRPVLNFQANLGQEYAYLGYRALEANRTEEAANYFQRAIDFDAADYRSWYYLGVALGRMGQSDAAAKALEQAKRLDPVRLEHQQKARELAALGFQALEESRFDEATRYYHQATEADGDEATYWYGLGTSLSRVNKFIDALPAFEQAVTLDPDDAGFKKARNWCRSKVTK